MVHLNQTVFLKAKSRKVDEEEQLDTHFGRKVDNRTIGGLDISEFFELLESLEQAYEASEIMFETGIDLTYFEQYYLTIVDILLSKILSEKSIDCIHTYLYGIPYYLDFQTYKENPEIIPEVKSISELWDVVNKIETNKGKK